MKNFFIDSIPSLVSMIYIFCIHNTSLSLFNYFPIHIHHYLFYGVFPEWVFVLMFNLIIGLIVFFISKTILSIFVNQLEKLKEEANQEKI